MVEQQLARVDLNLLVSLSVLLKYRNVSRAADALFLSQSAMSRTLNRLRDLFDDPLFHRTATGILPTDKALQLEAMLPDLLEHLNQFVQKDEFTPALCESHFSISLPAIMGYTNILPLYQTIMEQAPNVSFSELPAEENPLPMLESGQLDFALSIKRDLPSSFLGTPLGTVDVVIIARKGHPLAKQSHVTLEQCAKYPFAELMVGNENTRDFRGPSEELMQRFNVKRRVQFRSTQASNLIKVLQNSNAVMPCVKGLLQDPLVHNICTPLFQFDLPKDVRIQFMLIEHRRSENSLDHQWFREHLLKRISTFINFH
ncbi:LysR family transcriptional regulator [Thalassotalea sp. Y01]|uniref:LysR family transcriptional regulator n=1 Tax=Thalassotalea sp. Y01 TaxID=2729613 RepID=UPI00145F8AFA|nr:LysR family transcriptional regulator [Thalassotalea sp. Y01]NMP16631.1 LysR family transcriptional regulator [Thalassotalea sp. Y01]